MIRKSILILALLAISLSAVLAPPANATVTRVSFIEEFGFFT